MLRRLGPQRWTNVHATQHASLDDLIEIDNAANGGGPDPAGFDRLRQAATTLDALIRDAARQGRRIRALGSGWALTDIAITDGWLVDTKPLNACHEVAPNYFEPGYPEAVRPFVILAQAGISIAELNAYLEVTAPQGAPRSLRTAGIGAGQTAAGAVLGNTHGSALHFGATPEWVHGIQLVTGRGRSLWLERASRPMMNADFLAKLDADLIRDDAIFDAAVVSFGAFGIVTALAIETDPMYQLAFPPTTDIGWDDLKAKLAGHAGNALRDLHHYEFVFDPWDKGRIAMEASGTRVPYEPGHPTPTPVWIARTVDGFALAGRTAGFILNLPLITPRMKTAFQFEQYRKRCILGDVRATPGQLFTATVTYMEGYTESAFGVGIADAGAMLELSADVLRTLRIPAMSQVRAVGASPATLSFTSLPPITCVFEYGLTLDPGFRKFERTLAQELERAGIRYTLHWSKNSGITPDQLETMYGAARVNAWKMAREAVFGGEASLMRVFENEQLRRGGLA